MSGVRFYKGASATIAALSFACVSTVAAQQSGPTHRIRAVVQDVRNARQAHEVDVALRVFPGVLMSRTDFNTRNVLMEVTADCAIDREQMRTILQPYGSFRELLVPGDPGTNYVLRAIGPAHLRRTTYGAMHWVRYQAFVGHRLRIGHDRHGRRAVYHLHHHGGRRYVRRTRLDGNW